MIQRKEHFAMNRLLPGIFLLLSGLIGLPSVHAQEADANALGMVTGSKTGTYIQFGGRGQKIAGRFARGSEALRCKNRTPEH